jgi:hypothetical protein
MVQEPQLTRRQRRLLRRAERHARKAAKLRAKSGAESPRYVMVALPGTVALSSSVPPGHRYVVRGTGHAVHVVRHGEGCEHGHAKRGPKIVVARGEAPGVVIGKRKHHALDADALGAEIERALAGVDAEAITAEVERGLREAERELAAIDLEAIAAEVERGLQGAEEALARAEAAQEQAERAHARAERDGQRQAERAQRKAAKALRRGAAVQREVERAMRDGVIDGEEQRRIGEAAREAAKAR